MQALFLNTSKQVGGIETQTFLLAEELSKEINTVVAVYPDSQTEKIAENYNVKIEKIKLLGSLDIMAVIKIAKIVKDKKIDVLIATRGVEYWPAFFAKILTGVDLIFFRHMLDRLKPLTVKMINKYVKKIIAISLITKKVLIDCGVKEEKIELVYNGVKMKEKNAASGVKNIGFVGKIHKGKGVVEYINVARMNPDIKFLLFGEGEHLDEIKKLAGQIKNVELKGFIKNIDDIYNQIDILILPAVTPESFSLCIMEAFSRGIPVIASNIGGIPEVVKDGVNGFLCEAGDIYSISKKIAELKDSDLYRKISAQAYETAKEFSIEKTAKRILNILFN